MNKESLKTYLDIYHIPHDENQLNQLMDLMHVTLATNEKFNLTAIKDEDSFVEKMILDSALGLSDFEYTKQKYIDVGTGAGFPGMVYRILNPQLDVTLLDSTKKKIDYLVDYAKNNNLKITGISARMEEFARQHIEQFDYASARAVASLSILLELIVPCLKVGGVFIAFKGKDAEEEIKNSKNALKKLDCEIIEMKNFVLPESKEERNIIYIRKNKSTQKKYPREYSLIKKAPL